MSFNDKIGKGVKENYEELSENRLVRGMPIAIRIDGNGFRTFTKKLNKPFDTIITISMQETMKYLCENIQGCVLGYTQSDEITLILVDYQKLNFNDDHISFVWFDNEIQKICSISASMTTLQFNRSFSSNVRKYDLNNIFGYGCSNLKQKYDNFNKLWKEYILAIEKGAIFDARCFNIPKEEITNLIYWRQLDAIRNSIEMAGRAYYPDKGLRKKSQSDVQEMLLQKGVDWNDYPTYFKRGSCCIKETYYIDSSGNRVPDCEAVVWNDKNMCNDIIEGITMKSRWKIDLDIPIFKNEGREYIDNLIKKEEN